MPPIVNFLLLILQWSLILLGVLVIVPVVRNHFAFQQYLSDHASDFDEMSRNIGVSQRLVVGLAMGLCPIGIGGILFYLRRLFLSRR